MLRANREGLAVGRLGLQQFAQFSKDSLYISQSTYSGAGFLPSQIMSFCSKALATPSISNAAPAKELQPGNMTTWGLASIGQRLARLTTAAQAESSDKTANGEAARKLAVFAAKAAAAVGAVVSIASADAPREWQMGFQDPATAVAEGMIDLFADVMFFMYIIGTFYLYLLIRTMQLWDEHKHPKPAKILHNSTLEVIWTLIPCVILIVIAVSSFALLYAEEVSGLLDDYAGLTLKITGRQWYWSYKYPEFMSDFDGDSYMIQDDELELGQMRCLEVDNRVVLPVNTPIRLVITASDVVHSWAVPSLGIKCDAIPGRLNQVNTIIKRPGVFYGQCSELCGLLHYAMPICVVALPPDDDLWH